jgi:hypothetical protein
MRISWLMYMKAWHDEVASGVLVVIGLLLLAAGLWVDRTEAVNITLLVLGAGLIATGAFLPRIEGLLTLGSKGVGVGIPVAAQNPIAETLLRFEQVRETAERSLEAAPKDEREERVAETVGRAFIDLFPTPTAVTASVAGSALAPSGWPTSSPEYYGGAFLPSHLPVQPEEYFRFLKRLDEPPEDFTHRILSLDGISFQAAPVEVETDDESEETPS